MATAPATVWIGPDNGLCVGLTGFLIEATHCTARWTHVRLDHLPAYTNQSRRPRICGWCGSINDVSTYGRGIARVERIARNGRALVRVLEGDEARAVLEELGYPELASQLEA